MKNATIFLMFQGQANEAIQQYQQWFPDLTVESLMYMDNSQQVAMAVLNLMGLKIMVNDSNIQHHFTFTPSISIFVECESLNEINHLVAHMLKGGKALMPLDNHGFSERFAWIQDRFGVSWKLTYN
ncbi:VOC family protein [Lysinibacillus sp. FSL K6-0232]|uniref:VOC family protein n=1 Tax=Lysinibacillus sp. FSL K6-0232 TaxID=2921425 RepID=UPI0030F6ACC2